MKHFFITSVLFLVSMMLHAQGIYTKVTKYDKFDDVVWEKNVKTLITKTDSTIVIETKGLKPEEYVLFGDTPFTVHTGSRENVVNLVANVYGYQSDYVCVHPAFVEEIKAKHEKMVKENNGEEINEVKYNMMILEEVYKRAKEFPVITFRTISTFSFRFEYETDMAWIYYQDGSRVIYTK